MYSKHLSTKVHNNVSNVFSYQLLLLSNISYFSLDSWNE